MHKIAITATSILLMLAFAPPAQATGAADLESRPPPRATGEADVEGRLMGRVTMVNQGLRTMRIGNETYQVPLEVAGFEAVERRDVVEVEWEKDGYEKTVVSIRHFPDHR
jgi:hypothetical protein